MIELQSVAKSYGGRTLFDSVSISFDSGSFSAIVGSSGSGKTTLLNLIAGIDKPDEGHVLFFGKNLDALSLSERETLWRDSIGLVFQQACLIPELLVWENIAVKGFAAGISQDVAWRRAKELGEYLGVEYLLERSIYGLSGGEQQRVALARALFIVPRYLLADEPTSSLDGHATEQFLGLLEQVRYDYGLGVVMVSHDLHVYSRAAHCFVLKDCRVMQGFGEYCE